MCIKGICVQNIDMMSLARERIRSQRLKTVQSNVLNKQEWKDFWWALDVDTKNALLDEWETKNVNKIDIDRELKEICRAKYANAGGDVIIWNLFWDTHEDDEEWNSRPFLLNWVRNGGEYIKDFIERDFYGNTMPHVKKQRRMRCCLCGKLARWRL